MALPGRHRVILRMKRGVKPPFLTYEHAEVRGNSARPLFLTTLSSLGPHLTRQNHLLTQKTSQVRKGGSPPLFC